MQIRAVAVVIAAEATSAFARVPRVISTDAVTILVSRRASRVTVRAAFLVATGCALIRSIDEPEDNIEILFYNQIN